MLHNKKYDKREKCLSPVRVGLSVVSEYKTKVISWPIRLKSCMKSSEIKWDQQ